MEAPEPIKARVLPLMVAFVNMAPTETNPPAKPPESATAVELEVEEMSTLFVHNVTVAPLPINASVVRLSVAVALALATPTYMLAPMATDCASSILSLLPLSVLAVM